MYKRGLLPLWFSVIVVTTVQAWNDGNDAVLLTDINVLTLHHGRMTTARRSSPVPQLKCLGGTAGCGTFIPQVVQCYNRGSDGVDVQWECKTDMDNAYRFGNVEVTCEGYNYPDDAYVLKGSCGLEYTIDFTKEGHEKQYNSGGQRQQSYSGDNYSKKNSSNWFGDLVMLVIIGVIIYAIYVTCLGGGNNMADRGNPPPYRADDDPNRPRGNPPPYGFRNDYTPNDGADCSSGSSYGNTGTHRNNGTGSTGGGFWTGAGVGGMMGYLFGSRTNTGHYGPSYGYNQRYGGGGSWWNRGYGGWGANSGLGGGGWGSTRTHTRSSPSAFGSSGSSGTRTSSGFGGTQRR